jgi:hypothetical protein
VKRDSDEFQLSDRAQLFYHDWRLEITSYKPTMFQLFSSSRLAFTGELELVNNDEIIKADDFRWQFRIKTNRIEQWCNVRLEETLSLGMTYTFHPDALVIEYMARHRIPTRLDMRHQIQVISLSHRSDVVDLNPSEQKQSGRDSLEQKYREQTQHQNHEQPSDYLLAHGNQNFREAFSATQWIYLPD